MEFVLSELLAGAGDVATVAVAIGFWRLDKRLSKLEWWQEQIRDWIKGDIAGQPFCEKE